MQTGYTGGACLSLCVHVTTTSARNSSRILKESHAILDAGLADEVLIIGRMRPGLPTVEVLEPSISIKRVGAPEEESHRFRPFHFSNMIKVYREAVRQAKPDLLIAHSIGTLQACAEAAHDLGINFVYDCHELETERNGLHALRQIAFRYIERKYISRASSVVVVGDAIADWYQTAYPQLPRPVLVRNIPDISTQVDSEATPLREVYRVPDDALLFIFQGFLTSGRRIQDVLQAFTKGSKHHIVFMGYGEFESEIRAAAEHCPRVHLHTAVPPEMVLSVTRTADVGLCLLDYLCLSYRYSLPNKLFEYLTAGLPVVAGSGIETKSVIEEHNCGWVVGDKLSDLENFLEAIRPLDVEHAKQSVALASKAFRWHEEADRFIDACLAAAPQPRRENHATAKAIAGEKVANKE